MCVCVYSGGPRPNDERADGGRPRDKTERRIEPGAVFEKCGEQMRGLADRREGEELSGRNWREFRDGKVVVVVVSVVGF